MKGNEKTKRKAALKHLTEQLIDHKHTTGPDQGILELISYNENSVSIHNNIPIEELLERCQSHQVSWVNVDGLTNQELIQKISKHFDLHYLLVEDVMNTDHQPKADEFEDHLFFTLKMLYRIEGQSIDYEHISFVLGKNYLLSFQEKEGDIFDNLRNRIKQDNGVIRKRGADYLLYRLIDAIVDSYYSILDSIGKRIEEIEDNISNNATELDFIEIQKLRKEFIYLRKVVYPLREALNKVIKNEEGFIEERNEKYFSDVYDHVIHLIDSLDTYKDLTSTLMDLYMNTINYRMNEVMKLLTVITTIFIPLSFVAGVYGMNFENMPELAWPNGYYGVLIVMGIIFLAMVGYFRYKKWF
ncbi:MAG TPA: magnesium/cobalt transporter CorA [Cyclobacteriaceae bacterium]|nr:magnesium/cobalt transporter CorA [Cytophagales bacterium]HNT51334.1 magnesium/cobalt transporter CorA [Cyclobacteriaceae bacterium]HRE66298.1 magnesium/cobalt transporter CorA [Cyclobacteriaceae bacterium]HRF32880.1 magnesium/cobalt transporter CorA [Cyclobacteriaceae bacterium]